MEQMLEQKAALMHASWLEKLKKEFDQPYMKELEAFLAQEYASGATVYPPFPLIFNALCQTSFEQVNVVIMGQDPYHNPGQAQGLSFSVPKGVPLPPSLKNIYKELQEDVGATPASHGCLLDWARQGVLLLNATLTVRAHEPKSHYGRGWEIFTDRIVQLLSERQDPLVFILWGRSAYEKFQHIVPEGSSSRHLALISAHPSPFSAHSGFFHSRPFSKANAFLKQAGKAPIDWQIR